MGPITSITFGVNADGKGWVIGWDAEGTMTDLRSVGPVASLADVRVRAAQTFGVTLQPAARDISGVSPQPKASSFVATV